MATYNPQRESVGYYYVAYYCMCYYYCMYFCTFVGCVSSCANYSVLQVEHESVRQMKRWLSALNQDLVTTSLSCPLPCSIMANAE